jgi:hypothetical protein
MAAMSVAMWAGSISVTLMFFSRSACKVFAKDISLWQLAADNKHLRCPTVTPDNRCDPVKSLQHALSNSNDRTWVAAGWCRGQRPTS